MKTYFWGADGSLTFHTQTKPFVESKSSSDAWNTKGQNELRTFGEEYLMLLIQCFHTIPETVLWNHPVCAPLLADRKLSREDASGSRRTDCLSRDDLQTECAFCFFFFFFHFSPNCPCCMNATQPHEIWRNVVPFSPCAREWKVLFYLLEQQMTRESDRQAAPCRKDTTPSWLNASLMWMFDFLLPSRLPSSWDSSNNMATTYDRAIHVVNISKQMTNLPPQMTRRLNFLQCSNLSSFWQKLWQLHCVSGFHFFFKIIFFRVASFKTNEHQDGEHKQKMSAREAHYRDGDGFKKWFCVRLLTWPQGHKQKRSKLRRRTLKTNLHRHGSAQADVDSTFL